MEKADFETCAEPPIDASWGVEAPSTTLEKDIENTDSPPSTRVESRKKLRAEQAPLSDCSDLTSQLLSQNSEQELIYHTRCQLLCGVAALSVAWLMGYWCALSLKSVGNVC